MKIIAPTKTKVRLALFAILFTILSGLVIGSRFVFTKSAVDAVADSAAFKTVIIDAGHGGMDGGTSAKDGTLEKNLNLQIAQKLDEILRSMGIETVMTRSEDVSIHDESAKTVRQKKVSDIKNRLNIINSTENAVFVSIHQNHFSNPKYSGTQVFYSKNDPLSRLLAECVRMAVISYLQPENTREIKQSGTEIYLLYHSPVPSIMVECGFLSNVQEANSLKDEEYQRKLAFLIAIGIVDYFKNTKEH